jgi:hypothetical protein
MKQVRWFRASSLAAITCMLSLTAAGQTDAATALQQRLYAQFKLTTVMADRSDIVTPGDVVDIHIPGLIMYAVASPLPPSNTYNHGRIGQGWAGFGKDLTIGMLGSGGATAADYPHRTFVPEENCWITGIQVQKDGVLFQLYSDPYDDTRYYANLKIPFPKKNSVPSADEFLPRVAEVLTVIAQEDQSGQAPSPPAPPPVPMPVTYAAIPVPPPPNDMPPPTITLGQSISQVTTSFGPPLREVKLREKVVFFYKDMKVTFADGKVSNVE